MGSNPHLPTQTGLFEAVTAEVRASWLLNPPCPAPQHRTKARKVNCSSSRLFSVLSHHCHRQPTVLGPVDTPLEFQEVDLLCIILICIPPSPILPSSQHALRPSHTLLLCSSPTRSWGDSCLSVSLHIAVSVSVSSVPGSWLPFLGARV